jgi:peptide/nickel transport system permease protein
VLVGLRTSVGIAAGTVAIAATIALGVGVGSGMAGGWIDRIAMRLTDLMLALPRAVFLLALSGWVGALGAVTLTLLLGATGWMALARLLRSEVQTLRTLDYVAAARALGTSPMALVMRHVAPALVPLLATSCALAFADALLLEAALSFLGVGVQPPQPSLGTVLLELSDVMGPSRWLAVGPGIVLLSLSLAVHAVADRMATQPQVGASRESFVL